MIKDKGLCRHSYECVNYQSHRLKCNKYKGTTFGRDATHSCFEDRIKKLNLVDAIMGEEIQWN